MTQPPDLRPRDRLFGAFRLVALVEGITTLLLFLVAMPMKYLWEIPLAVPVMGRIHGYAFLAYLGMMVWTLRGRGWGAGDWARTALAAFLPFGTFLNDPFLRRRQAADAARGHVLRPAPARSPAQWLFLMLGLSFTGLGFVGAFLPVLPTVPFLLLAAACFARSSERLESWLLNHPQFGPLLRDWRARGAIPVRGKIMSGLGMTVGYGLFLWGSHPGPLPMAAVAALMLFGLAYVLSRPS